MGAGGGGAPGSGCWSHLGAAGVHRSEGRGSFYFAKDLCLELIAGFGSTWRLREPWGVRRGNFEL